MVDSRNLRRQAFVGKLRRAVRQYPFRYMKMATAPFEIAAYLKRHSIRCLNIGANSNRPRGWLSVDIAPTFGVTYLDATRMAALPAHSFDAVLCEHMIEHVGHGHGRDICRQIHRVLKPEGVARFVTPDLDRLSRLVLGRSSADDERFLRLLRAWRDDQGLTAVDAINIAFREHGHQYLYNRAALKRLLLDTGFTNLVETTASGHEDPIFRDAQGQATGTSAEQNDLDAFAFEVKR